MFWFGFGCIFLLSSLLVVRFVRFVRFVQRRKTCEDTYQHHRKCQTGQPQSIIVAFIEYTRPEMTPTCDTLKNRLIEVNHEMRYDSSPESHTNPENMFTDVSQFRDCVV